MDPAILGLAAATQIFRLIDWRKVAESLATDGARSGATGLFKRLKPTVREEAARQALGFFVEEFHRELEDKVPLAAALPGYHHQIKRLVETAAPDIACWMQPETQDVDLAPVERMWNGLGLDPLPEHFDWPLVARNFARDIRKHVKQDPQMREMLTIALQEEIAESVGRIAGPSPGFDLPGYRDFLRKKCGSLQLAVLHGSSHRYDRQITLWSVFVAQSARESVPGRFLSRDLTRRLKEEGQLAGASDDRDKDELRDHYQRSAVLPVLDVLSRERMVVILGDPGSGKTSLLKFLAMRWVTINQGPLPVWIDLKHYAQQPIGLLTYCQSGCATYGLDARELTNRMQAGEAAIYLDGLDEVFDGQTRGRVVEDVAALAARYPHAIVLATSRIFGYEPERLRDAGFAHATLEDLDDLQVSEFLRKWHESAEDSPTERVRLVDQVERALRESHAVRELAGNPLLLTMMAILNRNQYLPRDRVELYREASRVLLYEWDASRSLPVDAFARQEKEEMLRELAGAMQAEGGLAVNLIERAPLVDGFRAFLKRLGVNEPHEKATGLVHQLTERNFILCYAGADRFSFVHRTFLEYFCAAWFVELYEKKQTLTLGQMTNDIFGRHWQDETWHEVLRLITGMVGERQAEHLILFLMEQDGRDHKLANLMLAAGCLSEVRNRRAIQATDKNLRRRFVEEVKCFDLPGDYEQPVERPEIASIRRRGVALVSSVWRSQETRAWLRSSAEHDADPIVRSAAVEELARGWKDDPGIPPLLRDRARHDKDSGVRTAAVRELAHGWKDDPETRLVLTNSARHDIDANVRGAAVEELARGWKDDPETLAILKECVADMHRDKGPYANARVAAILSLARGWRDAPDTLPWLKDRAHSDENRYVRMTAVHALAKGWKDDPGMLPWLKDRARSDENEFVRVAALAALAQGWRSDPDTLPILKDRLATDKDHNVRWQAVVQLARRWRNDPDTLPSLKGCARSDEDSNVRFRALIEVARVWKDDTDLPAWLKECARSDGHDDVRYAAIHELARGFKDDPDTLAIIKDGTRCDEGTLTRMASVQELARGWRDDPDTLHILRNRARYDGHPQVADAALQELTGGWKGDHETLVILKNGIRPYGYGLQGFTAVREIARGWKTDPDTLPWLKDRARRDSSAPVRRAAMHELTHGWRDDAETPRVLMDVARSDEDVHVRSEALRELALGWKDDPDVIAMLSQLLNPDKP